MDPLRTCHSLAHPSLVYFEIVNIQKLLRAASHVQVYFMSNVYFNSDFK